MAISYTNILKANVLDSLNTIIKGEFPQIPIYYDENKGAHSLLIQPVSDDLDVVIANGNSRVYGVIITYQLLKGGEYKKDTHVDQLSAIAEHLKKLLINNAHYSPSSGYKWHDGKVLSIEYEKDEESQELSRANLTFNCTVTS
jgi:hypothetical protein